MNPGRREDPPVADDDRFEDEPGPEPEPEEAVEPGTRRAVGSSAGCVPLRNLSDNVAGRGAAQGMGGETFRRRTREPEPEPSTRPSPRVRAPRRV